MMSNIPYSAIVTAIECRSRTTGATVLNNNMNCINEIAKSHGIYIADMSGYYRSIDDCDEQWHDRNLSHVNSTYEHVTQYLAFPSPL